LEAAVRAVPVHVLRAAALAGAALVAAAAGLTQASPVGKSLREGKPITGILFGTDLVDHARHSDTLMWWRYDPRAGRADLLSIPRDTRVDVPGYKFRRVNEVYTYHYAKTKDHAQAAEALRRAVSGLLDVEGTPLEPQVCMHVDYAGFRKFIDLIGGVPVRVDEPMHYDDNAGKLHIHYEPGDHVLSGQKALEYIRFRGRSGDRGRVLRQMDFLRVLLEKASSPTIFLRWPRLVGVAAGGFRSTLSVADLLPLALEVKHLRPERITPALLPGHPRGASWEADAERLAYMMAQWGGRPAAAPPPAAPLARKITVKVRNGAGRAGLALAATRALRSAGFDVLDWGDYNARQTKTRVLDRSGAIENARKVAQTLGTESVLSDVDPALRTDVEVILGDDYIR
jgi:polyisoprenyl-teichoic acid--peptidoglycan teichoic acid transferase